MVPRFLFLTTEAGEAVRINPHWIATYQRRVIGKTAVIFFPDNDQLFVQETPGEIDRKLMDLRSEEARTISRDH